MYIFICTYLPDLPRCMDGHRPFIPWFHFPIAPVAGGTKGAPETARTCERWAARLGFWEVETLKQPKHGELTLVYICILGDV